MSSHLLPLVCLGLACRADVAAFADRVTTADERRFAADYLALLVSQRVDSAYALLISELQNDAAREQLAAVAAILAEHPPDSTTLIGVHLQSPSGSRFVNLSWEYRSQGQWIATNVAARHSPPGSPRVAGFSAYPLNQSLRTLNAFTLRGRSAVHVTWLLGVVGMPLFCLAVATRLVTARGMPKRWIWALVALIGVSRFSLDWTTGHVAFQPLYLTLFAAAATNAGPAAPWILTFALPVGAAVGLARYRSWVTVRRKPDGTDVTTAAV